jgi:hypothetical protein
MCKKSCKKAFFIQVLKVKNNSFAAFLNNRKKLLFRI